jgi:hypothetical protein
LELHGDIQTAVLDYRRTRQDIPKEESEAVLRHYEGYHNMLTEIYREELEHWINENEIIQMSLKNR